MLTMPGINALLAHSISLWPLEARSRRNISCPTRDKVHGRIMLEERLCHKPTIPPHPNDGPSPSLYNRKASSPYHVQFVCNATQQQGVHVFVAQRSDTSTIDSTAGTTFKYVAAKVERYSLRTWPPAAATHACSFRTAQPPRHVLPLRVLGQTLL